MRPLIPERDEGEERTIMKAVVYKEPYDVAVEDVDDAGIQDPTDVVIRVTSTAICGSDLHMYEGRTGAESGHRLRAREHGHRRGGRRPAS